MWFSAPLPLDDAVLLWFLNISHVYNGHITSVCVRVCILLISLRWFSPINMDLFFSVKRDVFQT